MTLIAPAQFRSLFQAKVSDTLVATGDTADVTLLTSRAKHTIFVQQIVADITTTDLVIWTFKDNASPAVIVGKLGSGPGIGQFIVVDYGPQGRAITEGKDLIFSPSGSGMAGNIHVDAYLKLTGTITPAELASG